ncbi:PTS transporter subunit EIIC [Atopobium sp. oral taxon 810]|uniref:PTS sugar transporter subunit IIC n=1 Tax=Atopobium sp. oral taxon 810 TaxID=712158 RepID=UPI0003987244|nr:PTS transporter subunit EIIC [Atopobium sp. oral taxon 810]ERI04107.1 putative PTS system, cellobiose-specific IIC component [Atopobium sp. oral taxon 810 str. F0209]
MEKFTEWVETHLAPVANKMSRNRYIQAIQNAFLTLIPFITIGCFALIIVSPTTDPTTMDPGLMRTFMEGWTAVAGALDPFLGSGVHNLTVGCLALWVSIGIGYYLGKSYGYETLLPAALSGASFLIYSANPGDWTIDTTYFGSTGLFAAIISSFFTVEFYRNLEQRKVGHIELAGAGVPPALSDSFAGLIPVGIVLVINSIISYALRALTGSPLPALMTLVMSPLVALASSPVGIIVLAFVVALLWWFGIHDSVITSPLDVILYANLGANMAAFASGTSQYALPFIVDESFWWIFLTIGGSGATLALAILCFFSKSKQIKTVGELAIIPAFFNINEPIIFGLPLMYNPTMLIPFVCVMPINALVTYLAMTFGLISHCVAYPGWNLPAPIGAFLATMDIKALFFMIALIALDGLLYFPFFKAYEKKKLEEEADPSLAE